MSAVLDNLFALAGVGTPFAGATDGHQVVAEEAAVVPAEDVAQTVVVRPEEKPEHPAQIYQRAYLSAIRAHLELRRAIDRAAGAGKELGISCALSRTDIDFRGIHRDAAHQLVVRFQRSCFQSETYLSVQDEFTAAFGSDLAAEIFESSRRYRDQENATPAEDIRLDLIQFWDDLARRYADKGVGLARSRAAKTIFDGWSLRRKPFVVANGKAVIEDRVWTEKSFRGQRRLTYGTENILAGLMKALDVFLEYAEIDGSATQAFLQLSRRHPGGGVDREITSGQRYVVAAGHIEFKTFYETWKWTLSATAAEKLREFIVEYGQPASD